VAVIGEALWIKGHAFGRQPTVTIGGRPAAVLSRTADGGILARVPVGAAAGATTLTVKQEHGVAEAALDVRRYAAVLAGGRVTWVDVSGEAPARAGEVEGAGARFLRVSAEGRAAYLVGGGKLTAFELPAPERPRQRAQAELGRDPVVAVALASAAHRLAVVREADVLLFDTGFPLRPRPGDTLPLPPAARAGKVVRAELSPDGRRMALALGEGNRVLLVELARLGAGDQAIRGDVALATDTRAPVLVDLAFAHDGRTLWVLAGDTAGSAPFGPQATRVFALRVTPEAAGGAALALARAVTVAGAVSPARISTGRSLPLASGAAVRLPPEKATVYLTAGVREARRSAVFSIGAQDAATEIAAAETGRLGGLDVTPEGRWLLAAGAGPEGRLLSAPADGRAGTVRTLTVGAAAMEENAPEVRIQP
jgi:hypothetical protein